MKMFVLTCFCLISIMFLSVMFGMKIAQNGIEDIKDKHNSIVKNESISHDLIAKQQKLEKMNTFNLFSFMGNELSNGITVISKQMIHLVVK